MIQRAVEKETREEMLEVNRKAIAEETQEKFHLDVLNASDNLADQAERLEQERVITEQERREFAVVTAPKGPPQERIGHLGIIMEEWKSNLENETDEGQRNITQRAVEPDKPSTTPGWKWECFPGPKKVNIV
jgi:hypothetical protein